MTDEHDIRIFMRRRHVDEEPSWLGETFVLVCDVDNTPLYEDLEGVLVHWQPGDDPNRTRGQLHLAETY